MALSKPRPTIVFVPGSWHTPAAFDPVLPLLHAAGYTTTAIYLPSTGVSPGLSDLAPDVKAVRDVVGGLVELGREVVVVAHSYGAVAVTEALLAGLELAHRKQSGLLGGVSHLLYVAALLPTKGHSAFEAVGKVKTVEEGGPVTKQVNNGDGTSSVLNGEECFYNDVPSAIAHYHASLLRKQSIGPLLSKLTNEAYRHIPATYLGCTNDQALNIDSQRKMANEAGVNIIETSSSHSPFLSQPDKVVDIIRGIVEDS